MTDRDSWLSCEIVSQLKNGVQVIQVLGPPVPRSALLPVDVRLRLRDDGAGTGARTRGGQYGAEHFWDWIAFFLILPSCRNI